MSKPYSEQDLSDQFDTDLIWRRKELSDMKAAIRAADQHSRPVLLKAIIAMAYAHWEGYVKFSANRYFEHLTLKKIPYSKLERQLYVNSFLTRLDGLSKAGSNLETRCKIVSDVLDGGDSRFSYINPTLVDTRSNLNADVAKDICTVCGVDGNYFEGKRVFIDVMVVKRRNAIAHGQHENILEGEIDTFVDDILSLMSHFRTLLENKIYEKAYLAA